MRKKRKILFATLGGPFLEKGFEYASELAKTLDKDIVILLISERKGPGRLEDIFAAAAMAESYGHETPRELLREGEGRAVEMRSRLKQLIAKCVFSGTAVETASAEGEVTGAINDFISKDPDVEVVLLGPSVAEAGTTARTLKKLVASISRPVVTMARYFAS